MNEDHGHSPTPDAGRIDVDDRNVRVRINAAMSDALMGSMVTPYIGLERMRKALAPFHISVPGVLWLEGEDGHHIFEVSQFGPKVGAQDDGRIITKDEIKYEIRFSWCGFGGTCQCSATIREVGEEVEKG